MRVNGDVLPQRPNFVKKMYDWEMIIPISNKSSIAAIKTAPTKLSRAGGEAEVIDMIRFAERQMCWGAKSKFVLCGQRISSNAKSITLGIAHSAYMVQFKRGTESRERSKRSRQNLTEKSIP